jgi:16S rRNA (uracil1498-N3)-methyltransferase
MELRFFYTSSTVGVGELIHLDEDTSRHLIQVLRKKVDDVILLTDGKGSLLTCLITDNHRKKCVVLVREITSKARPGRKVSVAVSLVKNTSRFEWFLEKAAEIGVDTVIPLICERTEKLHFRADRMRNILVSAMLQSEQVWITELKDPVGFESFIADANETQRFIAYCGDAQKAPLNQAMDRKADSQIILIGPEGDFTQREFDLARNHLFQPVTLGDSRLRTETAAILASVLMTR